MKAILLFSWLLLCTISVRAQEPTFKNFLDAYNLETTIEERSALWLDSTAHTFLVITISYGKDTVDILPDSLLVVSPYYTQISDFYVLDSNCRIYPLKTDYSFVDIESGRDRRKMTGLFLLDDFESKTDSLNLQVVVQSGHAYQSSVYTVDFSYIVPFCVKADTSTGENKANKLWLAKWLRKNKDYYRYSMLYSRGDYCD